MRREDLVKEIDPEKLKVYKIFYLIKLVFFIDMYLTFLDYGMDRGKKRKYQSFAWYTAHCNVGRLWMEL